MNAVNNNGDTPLHMTAGSLEIEHTLDGEVNVQPRSDDKCFLLTNMLEILLDEGAHHDFVNYDGKTALDAAKTDEARKILSERGTQLELKCIAAKL